MTQKKDSSFIDPQLIAFYGEPISIITRADLIESGDLIKVDSVMVRQAGFTQAVADNTVLTRSAYERCVKWVQADNERQTYQDETGRLWDVLSMLKRQIPRTGSTSEIIFTFFCIPRGGKGHTPKQTRLKALIHPDENGKVALTIMEVDED